MNQYTNIRDFEIKGLKNRLIIPLLLLVMPLIGMSVDLVSPSLPSMAVNLHLSDSLVKTVISLFLLGYALGNFFMGFLTDSFGRRNFLRLSLSGFVVFSLLPIVYQNGLAVMFARLGQGLTIGAVAVLARAIISDILPSEKLVRVGPLIGTMWGIGPIIGPIIGGYLQFYFNWVANFYFFLICSILALCAIWIIVPETIHRKHAFSLKQMQLNLKETLCNRMFMGLAISMGIVYSLIIAFNTVGPFYIQNVLKYSVTYFGHIAAALGGGFLIATFLCRYLLKYYPVNVLFSVLIYGFLLLTIFSFMLSLVVPNNIYLLLIISGAMYFVCGFIFPMSMGRGMSLFRHISGTASAVMYLVNILITFFTSTLLSFFDIHSSAGMIAIYMTLLVLLLLVYWTMLNKKL